MANRREGATNQGASVAKSPVAPRAFSVQSRQLVVGRIETNTSIVSACQQKVSNGKDGGTSGMI